MERLDCLALPSGAMSWRRCRFIRESRPMADAIIDIVGPEELPLIVQLYGQIFRPPRDIESFHRRYRGRYNILQLIARVDDKPVGFFLGFELKPGVFFAWFYGVTPD